MATTMENNVSTVMDNVSTTTTSFVSIDWEPYDNAAAAICYTLFILMVGANGLVMYTITFRHPKKTRLHFFIFHLALADFLVGLCNCLGDGIESSFHGVWYGGDFLCRTWRYLKFVFVIASNNLLVGMSIERFLAVKSPIQFMKTGSILDKSFVAGAWIISIAMPLFAIPYTEVASSGYCKFNFPESMWKPYVLTATVMTYVVPTLIITACYTGICVQVWIKWRNGLKLSEIRYDSISLDNIRRRKSSSCGLLPRAKIRSIKMTCVVCLAFVICWTPYFVFSLLDVFETNTIDRRVYMIVGMLYPLNSACNPFIFILFNKRMFALHYDTKRPTLIPTVIDTTTTQLTNY